MPATAPTAAPPSFYDNLPVGGESASGNTMPAKKPMESDADGEIMKGLTGVYRVLGKMGKLKPDNAVFKAGVADIKEKIKVLVVQGLKKDPSDLDSGEEKAPDTGNAAGETAPNPGTGGAPPNQTDETHSA